MSEQEKTGRQRRVELARAAFREFFANASGRRTQNREIGEDDMILLFASFATMAGTRANRIAAQLCR